MVNIVHAIRRQVSPPVLASRALSRIDCVHFRRLVDFETSSLFMSSARRRRHPEAADGLRPCMARPNPQIPQKPV